MSMKAIKDGNEYPLGFMPEHYPADRVYLDGDTSKTVQDAIERGGVSVTTDGVKTYKDLFHELALLADFSKVTNDCLLVIEFSDYESLFHIIAKYATRLLFSYSVAVASAPYFGIESATLDTSTNSASYYYNGTIHDQSMSVASAGYKITLYY